MLKIVHIQFSPESSGRAALRLHNAFLDVNIDSSILFFHPWTQDGKKIKKLGGNSKLIYRLEQFAQWFISRTSHKQFGLFTYPVFGADITKVEEVKNADIIYLHWILWGMLNLRSIEKLAKLGKPLILVMHDMWTITGGCHHSFICEKYKSHCTACPVFAHEKKFDLSWFGFKKKSNLYNKYDNFYFVSPSNWLHNCATQSNLTRNKPLFYIPNVIDTKVFKAIDKGTSRKILNLDTDDYILAFGAVSVDSPYKGWDYLKRALNLLHKDENFRKVTILIFGGVLNNNIENEIPFKIKYLGYLKDEYLMPVVYSAADVFIAPSLAEVFGYVILESLCCGTPVVAFDVGGIPDLIRHKNNGYLARYKDAEDVATGIKYCLINKIQGKILPELEEDQILKRHWNMIDEILNSH
jgi:glycosyltransferase involved in cell wall biosynthesis